MDNQITITEASKKLGINRSKLNRLINEKGIKKNKEGRCCYVDYEMVQNMIKILASEGKIRSPKRSNQVSNHEEFIIDHYKVMVENLSKKNDELEEKNNALKSENFELRGEIKLISSKENRKSSVIDKISSMFKN